MSAPQTPVRVLHVLDSLARGGTELVSATLIERTAAEFEHAICSLSGSAPPPNGVPARVPTAFLAKRRGHDWGLALRVARLCRRWRPQVVHARNWGTMDAIIGARLARVPVVIHSEHGRDVDDLDGLRRARLRVRRLLSPLVDTHVTVSRHLQRWLLEHVGVRPEKVRVVPNGVDTERFQPPADRDELRRRQGYAPAVLVFGAVGRLTAVKDYRSLLAAFDQLARQQPHCRLLIVGDGPERADLEAELRRRGLSERVHLAGFHADVVPWLGMMDVFVQSSLIEGMSNALLEAMAVGLPVVATAVGGTPEIVEPDATGLLVPPAAPAALHDALLVYAADPAMRAAHAAAGRARAATHFPLDHTIAGYSAVYRAALARRAALRPAASAGAPRA